ncbi:hypothetical protein, partial [Pseudomonas koreensis]|uniref:hypothetical protein n=1 Tax=Pseudomonas koreensis TaxID=198620 RepID=UPI001C2CE86F
TCSADQQTDRTTTVRFAFPLAQNRDRPVTVLALSIKKTCPSSVRSRLNTTVFAACKPIVEQFTRLLSPALGSGLD